MVFMKDYERILFWMSVLYVAVSFAKYLPCSPKDFGHGSVVCVCTDSYCDQFQGDIALAANQYVVYTSSKGGKRFKERVGQIETPGSDARPAVLTISINKLKTRQKILGFGGAFSDAATINMFNMSSALQEKLFDSYFSTKGIQYTIGRVPMASCDFSTRIYSYDDYDGDFALTNFSLAIEDEDFKIPAIKRASAAAKKPLKLFGSPWSAPAWLKTSGSMVGAGVLKGTPGDQYHKTWANYYIKFLKAYEAAGIPRFWGLTVQNEPAGGYTPWQTFQSMGYTPFTERDFVKNDLGPALEANGYGNLNLMIRDDLRFYLPSFADVTLFDPEAKKYVKGIAVHWYGNALAPVSLLTDTHQKHPDTFILATEASNGFEPWEPDVILGSWERGEKYGHDIMENLNHWAVGWTDWNLVLDPEGGPNWVKNFVDSPIIYDRSKGAFYKQPTFYHMGHFSKFILSDSVSIDSKASSTTKLEHAAFLRPDGHVVLVVLNRSDRDVTFSILEPAGGTIRAQIPRRAIQTYLIRPSR